LPTTLQPDPSCSRQDEFGSRGFDCTGSEMGHLFYIEFGATAGTSVLDTGSPTELAKFTNIQAEDSHDNYVSGTLFEPSLVYIFEFDRGGQDVAPNGDDHFVWAVRDGDVDQANADFALSWTFDDPTPTYMDTFGQSVALDGSYALVGASQDGTQGIFIGQAHLFDATSGTLLRTFDDPTPTRDDHFGTSVALDGAHALIGDPFDETHGWSVGKAHLFDITTGALLRTFDDPTPTSTDNFGISVALEGNNVLIGALHDNTNEPFVGQAHLFDATTGALLRAFDDPTPTDEDYFGGSVALDGNRALIGADSDDTIGENVGQAYLFDATTGALLQTFDDPTPTDGDSFGSSVAIEDDRVLIGAPADDTNGVGVGQAHLFDATTGALLFTFDDPTPTTRDRFGSRVALDGDRVLIGAITDDTIGENVGQAYLFDAITGALLQTFDDPTPTDGDTFGFVAIKDQHVLIGARGDDTNGENVGQAHLFSFMDDLDDDGLPNDIDPEPTNPDIDDDGIPDGSDPDVVAAAVTALPTGVFNSGGDPLGQRNAMLNRLEPIEQAIVDDKTEKAVRTIHNLRRTVDGCPDSPTVGEVPDRNDWIIDCAAQREIRTLMDVLITNLGD